MINSVVLVGRLANEPEMRYTPSGMAITKFRLAVTRRQRRASEGEERQEETDWLNIVTFGVVAENCGQYLDKGALVGIEGRVQSRTWETQEGQKRYVVIVANNVQFLESKAEAERRRERAAGKSGGRPGGAPPPEAEPLEDVPEGEDYFG